MTKNLAFIKQLNVLTLAFFTASLLAIGTVQAMDDEDETIEDDQNVPQKRTVQAVKYKDQMTDKEQDALQRRSKKREDEKKSPELNKDEVQFLKGIINNYPLLLTDNDYKNIGSDLKKEFPQSANEYSKRRLRLEINGINREDPERKEKIKKEKERKKKGRSNTKLADVTNQEVKKVSITLGQDNNLKKRKIGKSKNIKSKHTKEN